MGIESWRYLWKNGATIYQLFSRKESIEIMEGICYVVGAGTCYAADLPLTSKDLLIAVDGGYDWLQKHNLSPDLLVGDFDSIVSTAENMQKDQIVKLPTHKDQTDMLVALQEGKKKGYRTFYIYGGTGGNRISHTIANLQLLINDSDLQCFLFDCKEVMFVLQNSQVFFSDACKGYLSVFSLSNQSIGVTELGLAYEVENVTFDSNYPLGVSNAFIGKKSQVKVEKGTLLLVMQQENLPYLEWKEN